LWASTPKRVLAPREVGVRAARLVERGCEAGVFSGAVLVARGRDVLVETACGQANRRYGVRNSANTRFNLGSMNKMFTAVAVMQLVESGRVSLDDPLSKYADASWLAPDVSGKITIRHLLAHTSGLGSFLNKEFDKSSRRLFRNLDDYKPLVRGETPAFEPGTKFRYSNTGMLLLGVVVEQASGKTYFDYVQAHIFDPAGMTASGSWPMDEPVPDLAMGYIWAPGTAYGWRENTLAHVFRGSPAGGGYSTVGDLHRFATALQAGRLLRPGSVEFLWTDNPPNLYGRGFEINASAAGKVVGHSGVYSGISSRLDIYVERGYVVAILGNQDQAAPGLAAAIQGVISEAR